MDPISENVFAAECILKERKRKGKKEYLIKWKGWNAKWNSWEPSDNILDDRLFHEFESKKTARGGRKRTSAGRSGDRSSRRQPKSRKATQQTVEDSESDKEEEEEEEEADGDDVKETSAADKKDTEVAESSSSKVEEEAGPLDKPSTSKAKPAAGDAKPEVTVAALEQGHEESHPTQTTHCASSSDDDSTDSDSSDSSEATDDEPLSSLARTSNPDPPAKPCPEPTTAQLLPVNSGPPAAARPPPTVKKVACSREDLLQSGGFSNCTLTDVHVRDTTVTFLEL